MLPVDSFFNQINARLSRRQVFAVGLASAAALKLDGNAVRAHGSDTSHTWLLASGDELRPPAPQQPTQAEIDELFDLRRQRTGDSAKVVERWSSGPAILPWTAVILDLIKTHKPSPVRAGRALALFHTAASDAAAAAQDAQKAHQRPSPVAVEPGFEPLVESGNSSFPSEHAAIAGVAEVVIPYLFPKEPAEKITDLAEEAIESRLWAGANFRSDVEVGRALGQTIGERAVARGKADGSDAEWDGSNRLTGEGYWEPTPPMFVEHPLDPLAGTWKPWVLERGDTMRPSAPPAYGSPAWEAELLAVQAAVANRTREQVDAVNFWAGALGTVTPAGLWNEIARDLILRDSLDTSHAAQALAMMNVAIADAFICCWDAKFTYWTARPITVDPSLNVLIPTPPFPSYTSGHSTISAAAATVLGHVFPPDAEALNEMATEAKNSRLWAGIHFPIDNDMGATGGAQVGRLVVAAVSG
jgi:membrane-associated phospholipid phosphatase